MRGQSSHPLSWRRRDLFGGQTFAGSEDVAVQLQLQHTARQLQGRQYCHSHTDHSGLQQMQMWMAFEIWVWKMQCGR